ncbi:MAG TPA: GntR family transcriptional regulator [Asanoa sp.]|nr:GntR family transcriptional regulator [Asanoa sp.]
MVADVRAQLRQPKLGEMVAGVIRQRILDGEWRDGQLLPNQDALVAEFRVSRPSIREAMRILEAEGLITVRRGNVGGAVVHRPEARHVAYAMAMVLESRGVTLDDVGVAMGQLEATSAGLCASRKDRARKVVPQLRRHNTAAEKAMDDPMAFVRATSDFHSSLVELCGNDTLRLQNHDQHLRITEAIADGDSAAAMRLTETHFDPARFLRPEDASRRVDAAAMHALVGSPSVRGSE